MIQVAPGGSTASVFAGGAVSPEMVKAFKERFHLNEPVWKQYFYWWEQLFKGHFGISTKYRKRIGPLLASRLLNTAKLGGLGVVFSSIFGIIAGIVSGVKRYSIWDHMFTGIVFFSLSVPGFFFGLLSIYLFSIKIPLFPAAGAINADLVASNANFWRIVGSQLYHLMLPAVSLGLLLSAFMARFTRNKIIEVVNEDYVSVARAKGLAEQWVILKHVLRNALAPVITVLSNRMRRIVGGTVAVEVVFQYPGMGMLLREAVSFRDYPLLMSIILVVSVTMILTLLFADVAYAVVNPQIRLE